MISSATNSAVIKHMTDRNWQNNPPRGLAISIALEAGELLEHYQWGEEPVGGKDEIAEELADILIYAIQFAHVNNINVDEAIQNKLAKAAKKFPVESFQSTNAKDRHEAWLQAKYSYKKKTKL